MRHISVACALVIGEPVGTGALALGQCRVNSTQGLVLNFSGSPGLFGPWSINTPPPKGLSSTNSDFFCFACYEAVTRLPPALGSNHLWML